MENPSYTHEADTDTTHYSGRACLEQEMERIRRTLDPNTFSAPLNQGELTAVDKFKLLFLIGFPLACFILAIVVTNEVPV